MSVTTANESSYRAELRMKFIKANKRAPDEAERETIRREAERTYPRRK